MSEKLSEKDTNNPPPSKAEPRTSELMPYIPTDPRFNRKRLSRFTTSMKKAVKKIEETFPKNLGSLYDGKTIKVKSVKLIGVADQMGGNEKDKFNVFSNEDHIIKDLMTQFKEKNEKDKIPKLIRKKMAFNRLYNITDDAIERLKNVKKRKKLYNLDQYQENILKAVDVNSVDQGEIIKLIQNLNEIKIESDNVKALPPINIDIIKDHVYKKKILPKKKNLKQLIKIRLPLDEFEKEERLIKSLKSFKSHPKRRRNKNFDIMPQYIRDIFSKNVY